MKIFICFLAALLLAGAITELNKHHRAIFVDNSLQIIKIAHFKAPLVVSLQNSKLYKDTLGEQDWNNLISANIKNGAVITLIPIEVFEQQIIPKATQDSMVHVLVGKPDSKSRQRFDYCFIEGAALFKSTMYVTAK